MAIREIDVIEGLDDIDGVFDDIYKYVKKVNDNALFEFNSRISIAGNVLFFLSVGWLITYTIPKIVAKGIETIGELERFERMRKGGW